MLAHPPLHGASKHRFLRRRGVVPIGRSHRLRPFLQPGDDWYEVVAYGVRHRRAQSVGFMLKVLSGGKARGGCSRAVEQAASSELLLGAVELIRSPAPTGRVAARWHARGNVP